MRLPVVCETFPFVLSLQISSLLAFITWSKQQIQDYAEIFRKQVYFKDVDPKVVQGAISITQSQARKVRLVTHEQPFKFPYFV